MLLRILFATIFLLPLLAHAQVTDYYVSNAAQLSAAISSAEPGETIVMADGIWNDVSIRFDTDGLPGDTITLRAETPGKVLLTGRSTLRIGGDYLKVDGLFFTNGALTGGHVIEFRRSSSRPANHSRLTNTAILDYNPENRLTEYKWVSLYGTHNRVDHSHFEGKTHDGATLVVWLSNEPNYHRIDHNYFGPRPDLGKNGGETIRIGTSDWSLHPSHTVVEYNLFDRCDGEIEIISNKSGDNVYRHNTFLESAGTLTLRHGDRALVEGNFFIGNHKSNTGGVRIIGEDHVVVNNYFQHMRGSGYRSPISIVNGVPDSPLNRYFQVKRALVAHNTIVDSYSAFEIGSGVSSEQSLPPEDVVIANNIVRNEARPRINLVVERDDPVNLTWSANIMYGPTLGIEQPEGIILEDPLLEEGADGMYRPAAESPAIGAADTDYTVVDEDVEGRLRPELAPAIGAHELEGEVVRRPLTTDDVGVSYSTATSAPGVPEETLDFGLESYPNPVRDRATIDITLHRAGPAVLRLYDVLGREVSTLVSAPLPPGRSQVEWNAAELAAGIYLLSLTMGTATVTRTIVVTPR